MDQLLEILRQINKLSGVAVDALEQAAGGAKEPGGESQGGDAQQEGGERPQGAPQRSPVPPGR